MTHAHIRSGLIPFGLVAAIACGGQALAQDAPGVDLEQEVPRLAWQAIAAGELSGLAIAIDIGGDLAYSNAFGRRDAPPQHTLDVQSRFRAPALIDALVATAVLQLVEKGRLDLDAELGHYLPAFEQNELGLSLHHLLAHTSGLPQLEEAAACEGMDPADGEALCRWLARQGLSDAPGTCFRFTSADSFLAARVLEEVGGKPLAELLEQAIMKPASMSDTRLCDDGSSEVGRRTSSNMADSGAEDLSASPWLGAGCLCTNVLDLLAFQRALLDETLLSADSWKSMTRAKHLRDGSLVPAGFAYQLAPLDDRAGFTLGGAGMGARLYLAYYPTFDLTVALQAEGESAPLERIARQVARGLFDLPVDEIARPTLEPEDLDQYVGTYQEGCMQLEVRSENGGLLFDSWQRANLRLVYLGEHSFAAKTDPEVRLEFQLRDDVVVAVIVDDHGMLRHAGKIQ